MFLVLQVIPFLFGLCDLFQQVSILQVIVLPWDAFFIDHGLPSVKADVLVFADILKLLLEGFEVIVL